MGFTPKQAREMSVWDYMAAVEGYNTAHDPNSGKQLAESEEEDLFEWVTSRPTG